MHVGSPITSKWHHTCIPKTSLEPEHLLPNGFELLELRPADLVHLHVVVEEVANRIDKALEAGIGPVVDQCLECSCCGWGEQAGLRVVSTARDPRPGFIV